MDWVGLTLSDGHGRRSISEKFCQNFQIKNALKDREVVLVPKTIKKVIIKMGLILIMLMKMPTMMPTTTMVMTMTMI